MVPTQAPLPATNSRRRAAAVALAVACTFAGAGRPLALAQAVPGAAGQRAADRAAPSLLITHHARTLASGEVVVLTFEAPEPIASAEGRAFGQPLAPYPGDTPARWHALVGIDVETTPGRHVVTIEVTTAGGSRLRGSYPLAVAAGKFRVRRLNVPQRFVTPPASEQARIAREQKAMADLFVAPASPLLWRGPFLPPVDGQSASNFGSRSIYNGKPGSRHRGVDFASPSGAPVRAPNAGRVAMADSLYYSGTTVILDHGGGLFSLLGHLSAMDVAVGDEVKQGQRVGAVGATGRVTGPHLHWTVRMGAAAVDPMSLLAVTTRQEAPAGGKKPAAPARGRGAAR